MATGNAATFDEAHAVYGGQLTGLLHDPLRQILKLNPF